MCLFSCKKKPYVLNEDLQCYKRLRLKNGEFCTPVMHVPISRLFECDEDRKNFDKPVSNNSNFYITPKSESEIIHFKDRNITSIGKGFIHAYLRPPRNVMLPEFCVLSIIPKGTEVYLDRTLNCICAKRMLLELDGILTPDPVRYNIKKLYRLLTSVDKDLYNTALKSKIHEIFDIESSFITLDKENKILKVLVKEIKAINNDLLTMCYYYKYDGDINVIQYQMALCRDLDIGSRFFEGDDVYIANIKLNDEQFNKINELCV